MKILALLLSACFTLDCFANQTLLLAAEDSWPPFSRSDGEGISQQIIRKACASVGIDVEFIVVPYARALHMVKTNEVDGAFNVTKQHSTLAEFKFGQEPLLQAPASFYYPSHSPLDFKSIVDVPDNTVIALILGYEYGELYEQNRQRFKEIRVSNQTQVINLLLRNRVDMAIMFDDVADYYLSQMQLATSSIKKGHLNHISDIYIAFNQSADLQTVIEKLDKGLRLNRQNTAH